MKRFISLLSLAMLLASNVAFTANAATTYSGVEESNAFADAIIYGSASGYTFERTSEGNDSTGSNDVLIGQSTNDVVYFGFDQKFEGVAIDVGTAATGGSASVEYWNGSSWATLAPSEGVDIKNNSSTGVMSIKWTRPSSWAKTTVNMSFAEDGSTNKTSASLYFARLKITSDYASKAYADQFGILNYNVVFDLTDQLGADMGMDLDDVSFSSSTGDTTIYGSVNVGSGRYGYALYTPSSTSYTYTLNVSGFVQESATVTLNESTTLITDSLNYTQVLIARDPNTGNEVSIASATAGTANTTCILSGNRAYCPVPASQDAANATVYSNEFAPTSAALSNRALDTTAQASNYLNLNYAYLATVKNSSGSSITNATVEMGDSSYSIDCTYVSNGQYGCIVPTSDDLGMIRITASGYDTMTTAFSAPRDSNSDSQVSQTFTLATSGTTPEPEPTDDEIDLDVESMEWQEDGDFVFVLQNEGTEDVDDDENVYVSVYVDGDREYYEYFENESGDDFLDAGEDETFNFGDDFLDDQDEEYTVEICVDATDTVNEDDEANNCYEKDLELDSDSDDGIDLEVEDMYMDDDDLILAISNTGDTDVDDNESVKIYVYVDGDVEYTLVIDENDGDDADFFQEGETSLLNVGDNLFDDHGNSYDVEACVDVSDAVDEEDEDNNCREEDEDELEEDVIIASEDTCEDFIDTDGHWGEEYICNLFDRGVVEGYSKYYFKPDEDVTRAEFLKMALLGAGKDPYETSGVYYTDVSSSDWYSDYVTYATTKGYVEGYTDGSFRPNDDISRGEALVILLRIAGEDDYDYDSSDIDFSDVETYDWFTWAVVLADDLDLVDGYSDGTFRPTYDISRAEAAKIVDLAYEEFYQD